MQLTLALDADPLLPQVRKRLLQTFAPERWQGTPDPLSQLIHSMVSARTYDETSWLAFCRLAEAFPGWAGLAEAPPERIEAVIATVTHADNKARQLHNLIVVLKTRPHGLDLGFLGALPVEQAMAWLRELPGVGVKSAATTLNFSSLKRRTMVVDTHVHRVARRLGLAGRKSTPAEAYDSLMDLIAPDWTAEDLFELHWLLKGLGQKLCTAAAPRCGMCPLRPLCPRVDVEARRAVVAFPGR